MINGILLRKKKQQKPKKTTNTKHKWISKTFANQNKSGTNDMLYVSMWMKVENWQN